MPDLVDTLDSIGTAGTPEEIMEAVASYFDALSPADRAELPWGLASQLIRHPTDVAMWALQLQGNGGPGTPGAAYGRAVTVLTEATLRLVALPQ